ncbi:MAG: polysaccharide deacetylase family protein [Bacteroidales bacterium]|nr:polysaccharide deacetylase family protein [Bacteroidales bacterium]
MYLTTSPRLIRYLMPPGLIWEIPEKEKVLYLTFDDGPVAGVTDKTLAILDRFKAKATFFCVGDNVRKHPEIFKRIIEEGHAVGNHTFNHLNGWKTPADAYLINVQKCAEQLESKLFRPPYGRITRQQARLLSKNYKIIMWSVLSGDFDPATSAQQCINNVLNSAKPGSIIVMHDQQKSAKTMLTALPQILEHFTRNGFKFQPLRMD